MRKSKAFTLIELIAVLVILAILALIVTPLVLNIIKKARVSADKRSIDAYGRSIELAIADYLLDKGEFPTSIDQLTIEYTGDKVECETTTLKEDGSVYLAKCTVGGRTVSGYTYGKEEEVPTYEAYSVGDEVTYNNVDYYVIKNSSREETIVTLLKKTPLTTEEVNAYGEGHVNKYTSESIGTAYNQNGYGGMAYYSSNTCGYDADTDGYPYVSSGCNTDYNTSDIKFVLDAWSRDKVDIKDLNTDLTGYSVRLLAEKDLENLGYEWGNTTPSDTGWLKTSNVPDWLYEDYYYWMMTPINDSLSAVKFIYTDATINTADVYAGNLMVRPVITLNKSAL